MSVFISIGTNMGDRYENIIKALNLLEDNNIKIEKVSSIYETEPWGFECEQWFLNLVASVKTNLNPFKLLDTLQKIEKSLGRQEKSNGTYKPRIIDLDIIFYNDLIIHTHELIIPHKLMHRRNFVLQPLAEIAPDFIHPLLETPVKQLLKECTDTTKIIKTGYRILALTSG